MGNFTGTPGDNVMTGTAGADTMTGLAGNDTYIVNDVGDQVIEAAGEGNDGVYSSVSYTLAAGTEVETLSALDWNSTAALFFTGNEIANWLIGNAGSNQLRGAGGNDIIEGKGGDDFIDGGSGVDAMFGGIGNDTYIIDNINDAAVETAGEGSDGVYVTVNYTLASGTDVETLSTLDWNSTAALDLTGNGIANWLIGNAGVNQLRGLGGNDIIEGKGGDDFIDGGSGVDAMFGGTGNDVYLIDNINDAAVEVAGEGIDGVYVTVDYTLAAGTDVETLSALDWNSTAALNLTGSDIANWLIGNAGVNQLRGAGGNDIIEGKGGDDSIDGGTGVDAMFGGTGNDVYLVDNINDAAVEVAGEGADGVYTTVDYTLAAGTDVETLSALDWNSTAALNLTGSDIANWLIGNAGVNQLRGAGGNDIIEAKGGDDSLDGGTGVDLMLGGLGNDVYLVDDQGDSAVETAGEGSDGIYTTVSYALAAGTEVETLSALDWNSTAALNLTGNEIANWLIGNAGANQLDGGAGADILQGRGGADTFAFTTVLGAGNIDTLLDFSAVDDTILLAGSAGQPFAALAAGALRSGTLVIGAAAADADDYLIYNSGTGALLYDADGSGAGAAVQFATLSTGLALTTADFLVSGSINTPPAVTSGGTASIAENSPASTVVYTAAATDADGDRITWSLSGTDASLLTINAVTGEVRLNASADFEVKNSYTFNVVANDSGSSTARSVVLSITDVTEGGGSTPIINEVAGPNNSRNNAQAIDRNGFLVANNPNLHNDDLPSATIVGGISDSQDKDFFSITLQAGELLILDVDGTNGLDSHLRLYAANGDEIGDNDDLIVDDPGSDPPFGHNTDSQIRFRAATGGTYYFSIEAFQDGDSNPNNDTSGPYQINVSIGPPATSAQIAQEDIDALISGLEWPTTNITYSFPNEVDDYTQPFGDPNDPETASFAPFTGFQQSAVQQMLAYIASLTPLTFTQLFNDSEGQAKLRYAMTDATGAAHAYLPGTSDEAGSAWFNKDDFNAPTKGSYAWMGILHETGHALGLKHGHEFPVAISADRDSVEYSVMTYRSFPGQDLSGGGGYTNEQFGFPQTLMMYDIAALQQIYGGANYTTNASNTVYTWSQSTGEMFINGTPQGKPGDGDGNPEPSDNRIFMTVWDGGGTDTYDFSNYDNDVPGELVVDLRPGEWTILGTPSLAPQTAFLGGGSHYARGNIANALLFQGNTASIIENAIGSDHQDVLIANQVANQLTGGTGTDLFRWASSGDSAVGAADTITDFAHVLGQTQERIDLSLIDANSTTGTNDAFSYLGNSAFTGVAGQLRWTQAGADVHVFADLNGDMTADMQIIVSNTTFMQQVDFIL